MAHHSPIPDPEMSDMLRRIFWRDEAKEVKWGATGRFPQGKLTPHDEGEIKFLVGVRAGKVIIDFNSPVYWLGMDADQAEELSKSLHSHAEKVRTRSQ